MIERIYKVNGRVDKVKSGRRKAKLVIMSQKPYEMTEEELAEWERDSQETPPRSQMNPPPGAPKTKRGREGGKLSFTRVDLALLLLQLASNPSLIDKLYPRCVMRSSPS